MNQLYTYLYRSFIKFLSVSKMWLMHDRAKTMICFMGRHKLEKKYKTGQIYSLEELRIGAKLSICVASCKDKNVISMVNLKCLQKLIPYLWVWKNQQGNSVVLSFDYRNLYRYSPCLILESNNCKQLQSLWSVRCYPCGLESINSWHEPNSHGGKTIDYGRFADVVARGQWTRRLDETHIIRQVNWWKLLIVYEITW